MCNIKVFISNIHLMVSTSVDVYQIRAEQLHYVVKPLKQPRWCGMSAMHW